MARTHFVYTLLLALTVGAFAADTPPPPVDDGVRAERGLGPPVGRQVVVGGGQQRIVVDGDRVLAEAQPI